MVIVKRSRNSVVDLPSSNSFSLACSPPPFPEPLHPSRSATLPHLAVHVQPQGAVLCRAPPGAGSRFRDGDANVLVNFLAAPHPRPEAPPAFPQPAVPRPSHRETLEPQPSSLLSRR